MQGDTTDVSSCWNFRTRTKNETSWLLDPDFIFELGTELISSGPAATKTWLAGLTDSFASAVHWEYRLLISC